MGPDRTVAQQLRAVLVPVLTLSEPAFFWVSHEPGGAHISPSPLLFWQDGSTDEYLQANFLVNGLLERFVIDYGPNLAFTICCPKRSGNFHSGLTNIKPVKHKNMIYNRSFYLPKFDNPIPLRGPKRLIFLGQGPVQGPQEEVQGPFLH